MPRENKASALEFRKRLEEIKIFLLTGKTRSFIVRYAEENWDIKDSQTDKMIRRANDEIEEINKDGARNLLAKLVSNQWQLYMKALNSEDLTLAAKIIMDIAKLRGLDVQKVIHEIRELEGADEDTINLLEEELIDRASLN